MMNAGLLFLNADCVAEYSINVHWPDIGYIQISDDKFLGSCKQTYTITPEEGEEITLDCRVAVIPPASKQGMESFWSSGAPNNPSFEATLLSESSKSIIFDTDLNIKPYNQQQVTEAGRYWDPEKEQMFDYINQNSNTKVYNCFILGRVPNTNNNYIVLQITNDEMNGTASSSVYLGTYAETRDDGGNRVTWSYTFPNSVFSGDWVGNRTSNANTSRSSENTKFNCVTLCSGFLNQIPGRFILIGVDGSAKPQYKSVGFNSSQQYAYVIFISHDCFQAPLVPVPDYGDEPENIEDGFSINEMTRSGVEARSISDTNPYGLNSSYTGIVKLNKSGYTALVGGIFGAGNFGLPENPELSNPDVQGTLGSSRNLNNIFRGMADEALGEVYKSVTGYTEVYARIRESMASGILSCAMFPSGLFTGTASTISTLTGYSLSSPISCTALSNELVSKTFDLIISMPENSFIGFEPYVSVNIYIPYIGNVSIPPSILWDFQEPNNFGETQTRVSLKYWIDAYTGLCSCEVRIGQRNPQYTYCVKQGNISSPIPIIGSVQNGEGYKMMSSGIAGVATGIAQIATGNVAGGISSIAGGGLEASRGNMIKNERDIVISGSTANIAALLSPTQPYAIITYKRACMPTPPKYRSILGNKRNASIKVGAVSGFCTFYDANLSTVSATQAVKEQILSRLKSGVII